MRTATKENIASVKGIVDSEYMERIGKGYIHTYYGINLKHFSKKTLERIIVNTFAEMDKLRGKMYRPEIVEVKNAKMETLVDKVFSLLR